MRIFKANEPAQSHEDRARDARLTAIASRYRVRAAPVEDGQVLETDESRDVLR